MKSFTAVVKKQYLSSAILLALAVFGLAGTARGDEALFGYLYTTDTMPADHWEYEQWNTAREGKARGNYFAFDLRNEFEYGVTDRFSASLYLNSTYIYTNDVYDSENYAMNLPDQSAFDVNGMSVELRYRLLSPYTDGFGLALYMEPEVAVRDNMTGLEESERELEFRVILQKNFMDDLLVVASNFMLEPEWETMEGMYAKELWAELTLGGSYRFAPNWYAGLEFRNHMEFTDMDLNQQQHSAYFFGPNIHYGTQKWWWTLTILPQIVGWPRDLGIGADGQDISDYSRHLGEHEKIEARFKFGVNI